MATPVSCRGEKVPFAFFTKTSCQPSEIVDSTIMSDPITEGVALVVRVWGDTSCVNMFLGFLCLLGCCFFLGLRSDGIGVRMSHCLQMVAWAQPVSAPHTLHLRFRAAVMRLCTPSTQRARRTCSLRCQHLRREFMLTSAIAFQLHGRVYKRVSRRRALCTDESVICGGQPYQRSEGVRTNTDGSLCVCVFLELTVFVDAPGGGASVSHRCSGCPVRCATHHRAGAQPCF